jgi:uncharacterized protein (UPF0548 family)
MFFATRPSPEQIAAFLEQSRTLPLSYQAIGLADRGLQGFSVDQLTTTVGHGREALERGSRALERWAHFELGWVEVSPPSAPLTIGTTVCVLVRHLGFWSMNGCRVVSLIGGRGESEIGYAYGTLTNHAECGEEIFKLTLDSNTGEVAYTIRAASRPCAFLARLGYPVTRRLQARFRRDSAAAMVRACRSLGFARE